MKNIKFLANIGLVAVIAYMTSSCASSHDYLSNNFQQARASHHVIAILPFDVRFPNGQNNTYKRQQKDEPSQKGTPHQVWSTQEQQGSLDMQQDLFIALSKQAQKGRYDLAFQDFNKTNKILETNHIMLNDIAAQDKSQMAKLLGVDAIIWGQTEVRISRPSRYSSSYGRSSDGVETTASLYDAATGEMLWSTDRFERPTSRGYSPYSPYGYSPYGNSYGGNTPHDLADNIMEYVAKHLPYRVAKR